jgi:hypothetical protein
MVIALGFWSLALGYALVYTGVQWFTTPNGQGASLAVNLGLKSALTTAPATTAAATSGTGGPTGTGYPSSTEV